MNSRVGLIIVYLSISVPYAIWLLVGFFQTVPLEIEEAAYMDGANKLQVFSRVVLPIVAPGVVAVAIYTFINVWNEFLFSLILINSRDKMTVAVGLKSLMGQEVLDWGRYDGGICTCCNSFCNFLHADPEAHCWRFGTGLYQIKGDIVMKTIGYAIVGTGYFGAELGRIMKEQEGAKIVAVYDPENGETVAKELGCDVETDLDKLCSRDDVDAVLVASPNYLHKEPVLTAARHKKHVFCESRSRFAMRTATKWYAPAKKTV